MKVGLKRFRIRMVLITTLTAAASAVAQEVPEDPEAKVPEAAETPLPPPLPPAADATNYLPDKPSPEGHPCQVRDSTQLDAWIDRVQSSLYRITCSSSTWFDGLFGDGRYDREYRATNGNVTMGGFWSQRDGIDKVLRFRARMYFPQISDKFHAFIGRVDTDEFVTESKSDAYGLPGAFRRNVNDSTLVGLGYNESFEKNGSFDAGTGVHIRFPLNPYVKGSYRYAKPMGESNLLRLRETIFWENIEGFGTTTRIDWDHVVSDHNLLRWSNSGTVSQITDGLRWNSSVTFYQVISASKRSVFAYEGGLSGSTDSDVPLTNYGITVLYRQSVWRSWLLIELRTGVDWPRYGLGEPRRSNLNAGLSFELNYGRQ